MVVRNEIAPWPAQHADLEVLEQGQGVGPEALLIAQWRALFVKAAVYATAQVLDEAPENMAVDVADRPPWSYGDLGHR
jgi:hypothetical protein